MESEVKRHFKVDGISSVSDFAILHYLDRLLLCFPHSCHAMHMHHSRII